MHESPPASRTGPCVLLVDAHDSFTWNLVQALEVLGARVHVVPCDSVTPRDVLRGDWDGLVLSPGPGRPEQAGMFLPLVDKCLGRLPILGVCLGHQALGVALGASLQEAPVLAHGKARSVFHEGTGVFRGLPSPFLATRYHSLVLRPESLPGTVEVTARDDDGSVMAIRHRPSGAEGVQFHPESVLSECGDRLLGNFLGNVADPGSLPGRRASW